MWISLSHRPNQTLFGLLKTDCLNFTKKLVLLMDNYFIKLESISSSADILQRIEKKDVSYLHFRKSFKEHTSRTPIIAVKSFSPIRSLKMSFFRRAFTDSESDVGNLLSFVPRRWGFISVSQADKTHQHIRFASISLFHINKLKGNDSQTLYRLKVIGLMLIN